MFEALPIILEATWLIFWKFLLPVSIGAILFIIIADIFFDTKTSSKEPFGTHECDNAAHKHDRTIDWE